MRRALPLLALCAALLLTACHSSRQTSARVATASISADTAATDCTRASRSAATAWWAFDASALRMELTADSVRLPDGAMLYGPAAGAVADRPRTAAAAAATAADSAHTASTVAHSEHADSTADTSTAAEVTAVARPEPLWPALALAVIGLTLLWYISRQK